MLVPSTSILENINLRLVGNSVKVSSYANATKASVGWDTRDSFLKHEGVLSWFSLLKPWHDDFVVDDALIWLELEGVPYLHGKFDEENEEEQSVGRPSNNVDEFVKEGDDVSVAESVGDIPVKEPMAEQHSKQHVLKDADDNGINTVDTDPFELADLIARKCQQEQEFSVVRKPEVQEEATKASVLRDSMSMMNEGVQEEATKEFVLSDSVSMKNEAPLKRVGISMLEQLEETIKVGMALGFNMDGCEATLEKIIAEMGDVNVNKRIHYPLMCKETKLVRVDLWTLRQVWGNIQFDFASTSARGRSGGILCIWNRVMLIICVDYYVVVEGCWIQNGVKIMFIAVYAPQSLARKIDLWSSLSRLISNWDGQEIVMGDFNEVREAGERYGTKFNERQGDMFNSFITNSNLIDVPLGGIVLEKGIPDHRPIILKESVVDYGPIPFRFFHSWLDIEGFHDLVVETWKNDNIIESNGMISFKKKLQNLKQVIRSWVACKRVEDNRLRNEHKSRLSLIEVKVVQNIATREDLIDRAASMMIMVTLMEGGKDFLESDFLNDEIKRAVWECGGDRTPGPDGFTFNFIKVFWNVIELDVVRLVRDFFHSTYFPKGCNSSFISLIPKVANRLSQVIGSSVSVEQSAFISGRSILDGPLILCGNRRGG
ncbi:RNA-directed DNA polymerase, eukaryota, reverse transcriptase zinc-binding domain protein [Tanacetum coccineum]